MDLTAERLRDLLSYDPDTGVMRWRENRSNDVMAGDDAGYLDRSRVRIWIDGRPYLRSRLAWLHVRGVWPENQIDHANGESGDDRFSNLRDATSRQNNANKIGRGISGMPRGVYRRGGRFQARITTAGREINLGSFAKISEADAAYRAAADNVHGEFSYHRRDQ